MPPQNSHEAIVFLGLFLVPAFVMSILGAIAFNRETPPNNPFYFTPDVSSFANPTSAYLAASAVSSVVLKPVPIPIPMFTVQLNHAPEAFALTAFVSVEMDNGIDYVIRGGSFIANGVSKSKGTIVATQNANIDGIASTDASTFTLSSSGFPIVSGNTAQYGLTVTAVGGAGSFSTSTNFNVRARVVLLDPEGDAVDVVSFP